MVYFITFFLVLLAVYTYKIYQYQSAWELIPEQGFPDFPASPVTVSIIVAARNEEMNIHQLLETLCKQTYPASFTEIIIVDDHSDDHTATIVRQYADRYSHIKYIALAEYTGLYPATIAFKKLALRVGIENSRGELIITTDADCVVPGEWISTMVHYYQQFNWQFIAAPVRLMTRSGFLDIFQTLDFLTLQGITGAAVYKKMYALCNGANMAFTRNAFNIVNGYKGIDHIPSGDDLLLMHKITQAFPDAYGYIKSEKCMVDTYPPASWKAFLQQRIRWASKAGYYKDKDLTTTLILVYLVNLCFIILGVAAFFSFTWLVFFFLLLFAKVLIEFPFMQAVAAFFRQRKFIKYFPLMQIPHIIYIVGAGMLGKLRQYEWKSRNIPVGRL